MSANTPEPHQRSGTLSSEAGGAVPWAAGFLFALALMVTWLDRSEDRTLSLEDAVGPAVHVAEL